MQSIKVRFLKTHADADGCFEPDMEVDLSVEKALQLSQEGPYGATVELLEEPPKKRRASRKKKVATKEDGANGKTDPEGKRSQSPEPPVAPASRRPKAPLGGGA